MVCFGIVAFKLNIYIFVFLGPVKCVTLSPDRTLIVTGGSDRSIKVWKKP